MTKLTAQYHSSTGEWLLKNRCFFCQKEIQPGQIVCTNSECTSKYRKLQQKRHNAEWDGTLNGEIIQPTIGMFI